MDERWQKTNCKRTYRAIAPWVATYVLLMNASSLAVAASFGSARDVSDITTIENDLAGEMDIDKVMPHYAENAVLIDIASPGWYEGRKQIYAAVQPQLAALQTLKYRMDEISVASDGKLACAALQIHFDAVKKDNSSLKLSLREIDAFEKIAGNWRIVQQHISVPVDQKSSTAIFDAASTPRGALAWSESSAPGPRVPVPQARAEISKWLTASEIPKSIQEMAGYYGPGDDFLIFDWWSPREVRGHQEVLDYYGPQFVGVRDMQIKIPVVKIETDGAFGMQVSQQHLTMNMKDGTRQLIAFRQSDCVRRIRDRWYSFFEMGSFPVDTQTGKAVMASPAAAK